MLKNLNDKKKKKKNVRKIGEKGEKFGEIFLGSPYRLIESLCGSHHCRPFQRPSTSLWPPSNALDNLFSSGTQVPMDEMCYSNWVPIDEIYSSNPMNVFKSGMNY